MGAQSAITEDEVSELSSHNDEKKKKTKQGPKSGIFCSYVAEPGLTNTIPEEFSKLSNYEMNNDEHTLILETFEW